MPEIAHSLPALLAWGVFGYLLGAVPFGMLITKLFGLGNLREIGSGNIGATNVLRTGSKPAAIATLLLDGGKGAVAVLIARAYAGEDAAQVAGLLAFIGHCYPVWLGFRGGKGVATFLGLLLALAWPVGIAACLTWLVVGVASRISSLAALVAAGASSFWVIFLGHPQVFFLSIATTLLVYWRHRDNIRRLRAGTEPKFGKKKS